MFPYVAYVVNQKSTVVADSRKFLHLLLHYRF